MSESTVTSATKAIDPIDAALLHRRPNPRTIRAGVRALRLRLHAEREARRTVIAAYADGLSAERESARLAREAGKKRMRAYRHEVRSIVASRAGRRIDLPALLGERRADGLPVWALLDPMGDLGPWNGKRDSDGTLGICLALDRDKAMWLRIPGAAYVGSDGKITAHRPAGGIPPLPREARRLAASKSIRRRAKWVGLLYQPAEWLEVKPDPAIIVEWIDRPREYYALCVWGGDRARIMEFVD